MGEKGEVEGERGSGDGGGEEGIDHGLELIMGDSEFEKKKKHMVFHVGLAASGMNE